MLTGLVSSFAGAIEAVADFADGVADWLRRKERDKLVRKAESADEKQAILDRFKRARAARARNGGVPEESPANRDTE